LKIAWTGETYEGDTASRRRQWIVAALATIYTIFLVYTAGAKFLLLSCIIYAPGTILYVMARRENERRVFGQPERALCGVLILGAVAGVIALATGAITI
jgi:arginine:ornithine antiporter / lysine permease